MKRIDVYITPDGKEYRRHDEAESHCMYQAQGILKQLIWDTGHAEQAHVISQRILLNPKAISELKKVIKWAEAAQSMDEE